MIPFYCTPSYLRVAGVWKPCVIYQRIAGVWTIVHEQHKISGIWKS
jgi:hypothetical protein